MRRPVCRHAVFACVITLVTFIPASHAQDDPSFRGFWADSFHSGFKSTSQINSMVSRAVEGNYNAIIAEVLAYHDNGGGGQGAYWNSAIVPKAADIVGGIDPLAYLVTAAHAQNIEVHAWIVPYRVSNSWPPSADCEVYYHPEWIMVPHDDMGNGPTAIGGKYFLDPGSPDVQEYLVSIVRELVANYDIDGINLDYIRYTQVDAGYPSDESYQKSSLQRFRDLMWYVGTPEPTGISTWNDFRRRTIDELVKRLRVEIASITSNPSQPLRLTADLITFGGAPTYFSSSSAYSLHQNWKRWLEEGWLDAGIPMNYKEEHVTNEAAWYREWVNAALNWCGDRHLFCGQGNYLNTMSNSITQLNYSLNAGSDGVVNYSYYATAIPSPDWGWYDYVASNLFTSAVDTPTMPWRDPAQAVEGTLWGRVTDPGSGDPIDGAWISIGTRPYVETDGNGYFVASMLPASTNGTSYDIVAEKYGCPVEYEYDVVVYPGIEARHDFGMCSTWRPGDMDGDGDIDSTDYLYFESCLQGPEYPYPNGNYCLEGDADADFDLDMADFASFQTLFEGE